MTRWNWSAVWVAVLSACSAPTEGFQLISTAEIPYQLGATPTSAPHSDPATSVPASPPEGIVVDAVDLYFVASEALVRVQRLVAGEVTPAAALDLLAAGPGGEAGLVGLRTAIPPEFAPDVQVVRGVALVDLGDVRLASLSPADQRLLIAQLVLTLTSRNGVGQVVFSVAGEPIAVPRGRGDLVEPLTPVTYDDYVGMVAGN